MIGVGRRGGRDRGETFRRDGSHVQGLLYHYARDFLERELGLQAWDAIRDRAGVPERSFLLRRQYPDRYAGDLTAATVEMLEGPPNGRNGSSTGGPPQNATDLRREMLYRFGVHLARACQRDYARYFARFDSSREFLACIEPILRAEVRRHHPDACLPDIRSRPLPGGALSLTYASSLRSCDVIRGVLEEVAAIYGERATVDEPSCMDRNAVACEFVIRFDRSGSPRNGASPP